MDAQQVLPGQADRMKRPLLELEEAAMRIARITPLIAHGLGTAERAAPPKHSAAFRPPKAVERTCHGNCRP